MQLIAETPQHLIFQGIYKGQPVRIQKDKHTGEVSFNADDMAKVLGYKDQNDMMQDPEVQRLAAQHQQETGKGMFVPGSNQTNIHLN